MRTLELNKTKLWYVSNTGVEVDVVDEDGYFTGELEIQYDSPKEISLHLYPASGKILEESFGLSADLDFIASSTIKLKVGTMLFKEIPSGDLDNNYFLKINKILPSLNLYSYGLKGRR